MHFPHCFIVWKDLRWYIHVYWNQRKRSQEASHHELFMCKWDMKTRLIYNFDKESEWVKYLKNVWRICEYPALYWDFKPLKQFHKNSLYTFVKVNTYVTIFQKTIFCDLNIAILLHFIQLCGLKKEITFQTGNSTYKIS